VQKEQKALFKFNKPSNGFIIDTPCTSHWTSIL